MALAPLIFFAVALRVAVLGNCTAVDSGYENFQMMCSTPANDDALYGRNTWYARRYCKYRFIMGRHKLIDYECQSRAVVHCEIDDANQTIFVKSLPNDGPNFSVSARHIKNFGCVIPGSLPGIDPEGKAGSRISGIAKENSKISTASRTAEENHTIEEFLNGTWSNHTAAVLISHDGQIVAEEYFEAKYGKSHRYFSNMGRNYAYGKDMLVQFVGPLTSAITSMLVAIRAHEHQLDLNDLAVCPELDKLQKRYRGMKIGNLLDLNFAGKLDLAAHYWLVEGVVNDTTAYAVKCMSSERASTLEEGLLAATLLSRELRYSFPGTVDGLAEYAAYPWVKLFSKIGATSFIWEADASGIFRSNAGHIFAKASDFLRFGMLLAQGGYWQGAELIPDLKSFLEGGRHRKTTRMFTEDCNFESWGRGFYFHAGPPAWYGIFSDPSKGDFNDRWAAYNFIAICESCNASIVHLSKNLRDMGADGGKGSFGEGCDVDKRAPNRCWSAPAVPDWCTRIPQLITKVFQHYQASAKASNTGGAMPSRDFQSTTPESAHENTTTRESATTTMPFTTTKSRPKAESDLDEASRLGVTMLFPAVLLQVVAASISQMA